MNQSDKIKTKTINEQIEELKNLNNAEYLERILNNKIDFHVIAYFSLDDLTQNPYRQWISKAVLLKREAQDRLKQIKYTFWTTFATMIMALCALITILIK